MSYYLPGNLVLLRKRSGHNQAQLSDMMEVARNTISNWESDVSRPDISQIQKLAKIYKITLDELVTIDLAQNEVINMVFERSVEYKTGLSKLDKEELRGLVAQMMELGRVIEGKLV